MDTRLVHRTLLIDWSSARETAVPRGRAATKPPFAIMRARGVSTWGIPIGYSKIDSFHWHRLRAIMAMRKGSRMRSVNVAELKNRLSKYLTFAKGGEEVVIRDRNLPVAKLVPFLAEGADDQELMLVAAGKLRLPKVRLDIKELSKIPTGRVAGNKAIQTVIADREE